MTLILSTSTICNHYKGSKCRGCGSVGQPCLDWSLLTHFVEDEFWRRTGPTEAHSTPQKENNVQRASLAGVKNRSNIFTLHFASLARDARSLGSVPPPLAPRGPFSLPTFLYFCCSCRTPCISFIVVGWLRKRRLTSLGALCLAKLNIFQHFLLFFFRQQTSGVQRLSEREKENLSCLLFATCVRK